MEHLGTLKAKTLGARKLKASAKAAVKALSKVKYDTKIISWKSSAEDVPQSEAKKLLPPGASIWRANFHGAWQVRLPPHRGHNEAWSKYDNNPRQAMLACVKFVWGQWLTDNCLTERDCPIVGLFG